MTNQTRFVDANRSAFFPTLRKRVNHYFKEQGISPYGNRKMAEKTIALTILYLGSYAAILTLSVNAWWLLPFAILMGVGKAGIGMSVMHDALHGSYSRNATVNRWVGYLTYFIGANPVVWKIQHNVLHHTYTNIHGLDDDIRNKLIIRLSKHAPLQWIHRYQHIYVFFLYGFNTLFFIISDFVKLIGYHRSGMVKRQKTRMSLELTKLIATKILYVFFTVALPMLITALAWWQVLIGVVAMHLTAGYILTMIFQMAHIVEEVEQPLPNDEGNIENAWAVHQLETTANFARKNRLLNWYVGGLNFQIEHHLFPNICHIHYEQISPIVEQTAKEFDLPYHEKLTFGEALGSHIRMMRNLGELTSPLHATKPKLT
ncbi:acyl-CoA desaturase [Catalinimonas sp. 4WD22]|uniref:fatty acid desaturase family protein n=1 Tax=Catalinimonas locisalis TaxID=3133978 RepID=UPI003101577E